jgi:putative two-component system hydrogenase maturation factor HypX/HoxX
LNVIEASADPAEESWRNINAMDDLVHEIINTMSHVVIAGLRGNAGAGGAILALAADQVFARPNVVLNPHYRGMGELYGSEYWTYLLPKRVGRSKAIELTQGCQPLGAQKAREIGFLDDVFGECLETFEQELRRRAAKLAHESEYRSIIVEKLQRRLDAELIKPLAAYRAEELDRMRENFFGLDPAYHEARRRFVFKGKPPGRLASDAASAARSDPKSKISRESELPARAGAYRASARHNFEVQLTRPLEQVRKSPNMAHAWANMLQLSIRRLFSAAP